MICIIPLLVRVLLLVMSVVNYVHGIRPSSSVYYSQPDIIFCDALEYGKGCRHEIGHKMDWDLGNPSQSIEFSIAAEVIVQTMWAKLELDPLAVYISLYPDDGDPIELYAGIYGYVDGDISKLPESLQKFYTDDPYYLDLYDCLAKSQINICGKNISILKEKT